MRKYKLIINGERYQAHVIEYSANHAKLNINGQDYLVQIEDDARAAVPILGEQEKAVPLAPSLSSGFEAGGGELHAPLPGVIVSIPVKEGDEVKKGQTVMTIEAMKMESEISSPINGKIRKILVKERSLVQEGDVLLVLEGEEVKTPPSAAKTPRKTPTECEQLAEKADRILRAPIPGTILDVKVSPGQMVKEGDVALILEAMKMESDIHFNLSGKVVMVHVARGDSVQEGDPLIELGE